ncbi:MAG: FecR domain-containing protein [Hyphomicrobiales bacterium]
MSLRRNSLAILALGLLLHTPAANAATAIGKVVAVLGSPSASGPGGDRKLSAGSPVYEHDKIKVGNGNAQIVLNDDTKLVVGPGSELQIESFLMRGGNTAQKVSVNALRGTFRFITGKSKKSAYDVETASATIGIRGTGFDFWVRGQTGLALMQGHATLCAKQGGKKSAKCVNLDPTCELGRAGGTSATIVSRGNQGQFIYRNLPYIINQSPLRTQFHLPVSTCSAYVNGPGGAGGQGNQGNPANTSRGVLGNDGGTCPNNPDC